MEGKAIVHLIATNNEESCVDTLPRRNSKELSDSDIQVLTDLLRSKTVRELCSIASNVSVQLTVSVRMTS